MSISLLNHSRLLSQVVARRSAVPPVSLFRPQTHSFVRKSAMRSSAADQDLVSQAIGSSVEREWNKNETRVPSVAIIGSGSVGAAVANAVINQRIGAQLVMVDLDKEKCLGEVLDLSDAAAMAGCSVNMAEMNEAGKADVVIITAGARSKPGEPRTDLIDRNVKIMKSIMEGMQPIGNNTVIMQVANPVDPLACVAHKLWGLPSERVIGSGTLLDALRLRSSVASVLGVSSQSVHLNVVGEHGDSQVALWSSGSVGGVPLKSFKQLTPGARRVLETNAIDKANEIIKRKGATFFGIAACAATITRSVLLDMGLVLPVSTWSDEYGTYISQPAVIGRGGIKNVLEINADEQEKAALKKSAAHIREVLDSVKM